MLLDSGKMMMREGRWRVGERTRGMSPRSEVGLLCKRHSSRVEPRAGSGAVQQQVGYQVAGTKSQLWSWSSWVPALSP